MGSDYNLVGDNSTDNVTALTNAITAANSQGRALFIPKGIYLVDDSWVALQVTNLTLIGEPGTIIKHSVGPTVVVRDANENMVRLATGGTVRLHGITFEDWGRVVDIDDQAAITLLEVDDCTFDGCSEPISGEANYTASFTSSVFPVGDVERCVINRNRFINTRMCGVRIRSSHLKSLLVTDNIFDGWQVAPATGHGWRGLHIWDGFPQYSGTITGLNWKNRNTIVHRNVFRNITISDTTAAVLVAVQVQGSFCDVSYNHFENMTNTYKSQTSECVYIKSRYCNVSHNTVYNAGQYQGSISVKGYPEDTDKWDEFAGGDTTIRDNFAYAIQINHNRIICDDSITVPRLGISCWSGGHVQITHNYIQGCSTGIFCQINSNVEEVKINWDISHNTIRDCFSYEGADSTNEFYAAGFNDHVTRARAPAGIVCQSGMSFSKVDSNYIDNVIVNYTGFNSYGMLIGTAGFPATGLRVSNNEIRRISKGTFGAAFNGVTLQSAASQPFYDLRFEGNSIRGCNIGVWLSGDGATVDNATGFFRDNFLIGTAGTGWDFYTGRTPDKPAGIIDDGSNYRRATTYGTPTAVVWD